MACRDAVYLPGRRDWHDQPAFHAHSDYRDVESLNMFAELRNDGRMPTSYWQSSPVNPVTTAARPAMEQRR